MNILDVVKNINHFSDEHTIYAVRPWTLHSEAVVMEEPEEDLIPEQLRNTDMEYFLEIYLVREIIEDIADDKKYSTIEAKTQRIIEYAINDC
jgi:hypothetical protein